MASALSNTHAGIFTQLPKIIRKVWKAKPVLVKTTAPIETVSNKHEYSLIEEVEVVIRFVDLPESDVYEFCESDDINEDKIQAWQAGKQQWQKLDEAINTGIKELQKLVVEAANVRHMTSVDILKHHTTQYIRQPMTTQMPTELPRVTINSTQRVKETQPSLVGYAKTLMPDDSASRVHYASTAQRSESSKRRHRNKHSDNYEIARNLLNMTLNKK